MITFTNWRYRCNGFVGLWPEPYLEVDAAGVVIEWNPRAEEVFGWRRDELVGRPPSRPCFRPCSVIRWRSWPPRRWVERFDPGTTDSNAGEHLRFELMNRSGHRVAVDGRLFITGSGTEPTVGGFVNLSEEDHRPGWMESAGPAAPSAATTGAGGPRGGPTDRAGQP